MLTNKRTAKCHQCGIYLVAGAGMGVGASPYFADYYLCSACHAWSVSAETARTEAKADLQKIETLVSSSPMAWRIMDIAGQLVWNAGPDAVKVAQEIRDRLSLLPELNFVDVLAEINQCGKI